MVSTMDPYYSSHYNFFDQKKRSTFEEYGFTDQEQEEEAIPTEIETLPLFPMHGEDINGFTNMKSQSDHGYWYYSENGNINGASRTSLELSLNSYGRRSPDSR